MFGTVRTRTAHLPEAPVKNPSLLSVSRGLPPLQLLFPSQPATYLPLASLSQSLSLLSQLPALLPSCLPVMRAAALHEGTTPVLHGTLQTSRPFAS